MPATPRAKRPSRSRPTSPSAAGPAAIVLTGPPGRLQASVSVENTLDQRVTLRGLLLHREGHPAVSGAAAALLPPGSTVEVPVTFRLDPATPPGTHPAEVEMGGTRRPAVVVVEPRPSIHVSPGRVLADPGEQDLTLTVTNDGNVPIALATLSRARTDDGGPEPGPDVGLAIVDPPVLAPATTVTVPTRLQVPDGLDPTRRHVARLPVGTADLEIIILSRTASETKP